MKLTRAPGEHTTAAMRRFLEEQGGLQPAALVRTGYGTAIVIKVGENLSKTWQSGDILFIWDHGEHTGVADDEEIEILVPNLWSGNTMLAALKDAVSRFAQIASGCTHGPCNPDNPCDHCIALGWLETHGSLKIFERERE